MLSRTIVAVAATLFIVTSGASAQEPGLSLELRGGYGFPVGEWAEEENIDPGFGFTLAVLYPVYRDVIRVYAGYDRYSLNLSADDNDQTADDLEVNAVDEGFRGGVRLSLPTDAFAIPFVDGGLLYQRLNNSIGGSGFSFGVGSNWALGFEVGGGFVLGLESLQPFRFVPAVRYRQHALDYDAVQERMPSSTAATVVVEIGVFSGS